VILFGNFGETEGKILATTFTIAVTSILGLACGAYLETKQGKILPSVGIIFSIISAIFFFVMIWGGTVWQNENFFKSLATATIFAVSCSHLSLISIPKLDKKFQWSKSALYICVWLLSAILLWILWFAHDAENEFIIRIIGVLSIIIAALTIITPVFYKLSHSLPEAKQIDEEIERLKAKIAELEEQKAKLGNI
jgi:glucan phosphoethanolaminetransferase (alkaline phosphatase superfamily)